MTAMAAQTWTPAKTEYTYWSSVFIVEKICSCPTLWIQTRNVVVVAGCGVRLHGLNGKYNQPWRCSKLSSTIHGRVECLLCHTRAIASIGCIGGNIGWICPRCGPDEHGKAHSYSILDMGFYYYPERATEIKEARTQTTLEGF